VAAGHSCGFQLLNCFNSFPPGESGSSSDWNPQMIGRSSPAEKKIYIYAIHPIFIHRDFKDGK
jgi:hypothetical protein